MREEGEEEEEEDEQGGERDAVETTGRTRGGGAGRGDREWFGL